MLPQHFASLVPVLAAVYAFSAVPAFAAESGPLVDADGKPLLLAKKKKKKKKKEEDDGDFGPPDVAAIEGDGDSGVGVHREQEGVDTPYKMEIQGQGDISSVSRKVGEGDAVSETQVSIASGGVFLLGKIGIGGELAIDYSGGETDQTTTEGGVPKTETVDTSTLGVSIGPLFKFNFGKVDSALLLPYVAVSLGYRMASTTIGKDDPIKSSGYYAKFGGGLNIFLDSNVAINPGLQYRIVNDKTEPKVGDPVEFSESGIHFLGGFAIFL